MYRNISLLSICLLSLFGCGRNPLTNVPPLEITIFPSNSHHSYLTITIEEIEFLQGIGDYFGKGEFRLFLLVGDNKATSGGLFCPGDAPLKVVPKDRIIPCNLALSIPENTLSDELYVVVIGVDEDQASLTTDLARGTATQLITNEIVNVAELAYKARKVARAGATVGATTGGPGIFVGKIAIEVLLGYASDRLQEWVEQRDIIGLQMLYLQRHMDDWGVGNTITLITANAELRIVLRIDRTATPGTIVLEPENRALLQPSPTLPPTATQRPTVIIATQTRRPSTPTLTPRPTVIHPTPTPKAPYIVNFTLINAETNLPIPGYDPMADGAIIDLSNLRANNLDIRANTYPNQVGSVLFTLNPGSYSWHENESPYALMHDLNGDYSHIAWLPMPGVYTLTAMPYSLKNLSGGQGTGLTIRFTVRE